VNMVASHGWAFVTSAVTFDFVLAVQEVTTAVEEYYSASRRVIDVAWVIVVAYRGVVVGAVIAVGSCGLVVACTRVEGWVENVVELASNRSGEVDRGSAFSLVGGGAAEVYFERGGLVSAVRCQRYRSCRLCRLGVFVRGEAE